MSIVPTFLKKQVSLENKKLFQSDEDVWKEANTYLNQYISIVIIGIQSLTFFYTSNIIKPKQSYSVIAIVIIGIHILKFVYTSNITKPN